MNTATTTTAKTAALASLWHVRLVDAVTGRPMANGPHFVIDAPSWQEAEGHANSQLDLDDYPGMVLDMAPVEFGVGPDSCIAWI